MTTMSTIDLSDFTHDPAGALDRVAAGEHLVVCRDGQPVAGLRPLTPSVKAPRPFGLAAGEFAVPVDFDEPLAEEILLEFEGQ